MGALIAFLLIPVTALWHGFVVSKLWLWFMVPVGAKQLGWAGGYGLSLLANCLLFGSLMRLQNDTSWTWKHGIVASFIGGAMFLLFGWLATLFM